MKIRVNEISFRSSILHNHAVVYSIGCYDVSKTGNTKSFSKTIYGAPY